MSKKTRPESAVYPKHFKPWDLEPFYSIHVSAMTTEQLHDKADIAEQLAWRDREIASLRDQLGRLVYADQPAPTETGPQGAPQNAVDVVRAFVALSEPQGAPDPRLADALAHPPGPRHARLVEGEGAPRLLCDGCGCDEARCDAIKPPAIKCCPDCRHVVPAGEVGK